MNVITKTVQLPDGRVISIETGKVAKQADGSAVLRLNNTVLLATVCAAKDAVPGTDFMPLQCDYREQYAAAGRFPGGFTKREGRPSDYEILTSRLVDRVLRPLFPSNYHAEVFVNIMLLSADGVDLPDALAGFAASAALACSDIPIEAPIGECRVARVDGEYVVNPTKEQLDRADMDIMVGATAENIMMVEGEMKEVSEQDLLGALKAAHEAIKPMCALQVELSKELGTDVKRTYDHEVNDEELREQVKQECYQPAYDITGQALEKQITSLLVAKITDVPSEKGDTYTTADVFASMIENRIFKESMLQSGLPVMELFLSTGENAKEYYLETLEQQILNNGPIKDYPESIKAFYDLLITLMRDEERLSYQYQRDEDFYVPYAAGEKGAYDLFSHALAHQYIPLEEYKLEESMLPEDKIPVIVRDEISRMSQSSQFQTMVYQRMVKDAWFSASDMLLLLYEQGILSTEDGSRDRLVNEEESPLQILLMKIQNLELTPQQIALDPCSGSVVVTDPFSGEVLAMSSYPSFDPMRFMNDNAYYDEIVLDITSPLSFRAVYEARAIGSTYKMCTAITALELGVIDEKTKIKDGYEFPYVNSVDHPHCWTEVSHGEINVAEALDHSCNYFFYQLGYLLSEPDAKHQFDDSVGLKKMANYAKKLGLASVTGIEIGETVPRTSEIDAVRSSIGQGTNAFTTANVNRYTCTLINGGDVYSLYMVDEVKDPGGRTLYLSDAKAEYNAEVKEENLQIVRKGMRMVVTDEHKDEFAPLESIGIHAAGKTGTVQEIEDRPDHSLFTGYTTVENPEITVTIMIPFGGGSHNAIPVFIDVVTAYYGIFS